MRSKKQRYLELIAATGTHLQSHKCFLLLRLVQDAELELLPVDRVLIPQDCIELADELLHERLLHVVHRPLLTRCCAKSLQGMPRHGSSEFEGQ